MIFSSPEQSNSPLGTGSEQVGIFPELDGWVGNDQALGFLRMRTALAGSSSTETLVEHLKLLRRANVFSVDLTNDISDLLYHEDREVINEAVSIMIEIDKKFTFKFLRTRFLNSSPDDEKCKILFMKRLIDIGPEAVDVFAMGIDNFRQHHGGNRFSELGFFIIGNRLEYPQSHKEINRMSLIGIMNIGDRGAERIVDNIIETSSVALQIELVFLLSEMNITLRQDSAIDIWNLYEEKGTDDDLKKSILMMFAEIGEGDGDKIKAVQALGFYTDDSISRFLRGYLKDIREKSKPWEARILKRAVRKSLKGIRSML